MSMHEELTDSINREIESLGSAIALSPTTVALAVQRHFSATPIEPHIQYTSLEHIKHMARRILAGRFQPDGEDNDSHQQDMFTGHLQDRYPIPHQRGEDPIYKHREALTAKELRWNVEQLRKSAAARLRHADALQAWAESRVEAEELAGA